MIAMDEDKTTNHKVHDLFDALRQEIDRTYPHSRERSLALTKLDECGLWLSAAKDETS